MAIPIEMPRLSDTMEEGTLIKWRVSVGDKVKSGDILADVETDKATMELQAFDDGTIAKLVADEGETLPVGQVIVVLAEEDEDPEEAAKSVDAGEGKKSKAAVKEKDKKQSKEQAKSKGKDEDKDAEEPDEEEEEEPQEQAEGAASDDEEGEGDEAEEGEEDEEDEEGKEGDEEAKAEEPGDRAKGRDGRIRVSPLARRMAEEAEVDLDQLKGSGPSGRIIKRDVQAAIQASGKKRAKGPARPQREAAPAKAPASGTGAAKLEARTFTVSGMRKTIAKRLVESKTTIPHFTVTVTVNTDPLLQLRTTLNAQLESQNVKLSVNDFIVRGCALALMQHPLLNTSWGDGKIEQHGEIHVGVAVALPAERGGGLVVPVIRDAATKGLRQISVETRKLAKKAREQGLGAEEMQGGTFTVSNLGMFGVDHFEAIINPPQAAILAVGAALRRPVVRSTPDGQEQIVIGSEMTCTLSADHRLVDGAMAAEYLQTLKQLLENPAVLLV